MTSQDALIEFKVKLPQLSKNEKAVLKLLIEAGKLIAPLYLEQEKEVKNQLSKEEIKKASEKTSSVLSPYTVVEKLGGQIVVTPYHIKYAKLIKPIAEKLNQAANVTNNQEFSKALKIQAEALINGTYDEAAIAWLKIKPYILDISIGPLWHFDDKLFFSKASYHAWVGIVEQEGTERLNNYKSIALGVRRKALVAKGHMDNLDKVKAKVLDVVLFSGLMAKAKFAGINLPVDINIVEKYGSEVTLFNQPNDLRLKEQILPSFNKIFPQPFKKGFTSEDLRRGYLRCVALHELAHSYLYYKDSQKNLLDLFPCIYELAATTLGLRVAGALLLKDRITQKQLESMIVAFTSRSFYLKETKDANSMSNYALGGTIFINFMIESGSLKIYNNSYIPNFTKMFVSIYELSLELEKLLSQGSREDAANFIKRYSL